MHGAHHVVQKSSTTILSLSSWERSVCPFSLGSEKSGNGFGSWPPTPAAIKHINASVNPGFFIWGFLVTKIALQGQLSRAASILGLQILTFRAVNREVAPNRVMNGPTRANRTHREREEGRCSLARTAAPFLFIRNRLYCACAQPSTRHLLTMIRPRVKTSIVSLDS